MKQEITEAAIKWGVPQGITIDKNSTEKIVSIWIQEVVMEWWMDIGEDKRQEIRGNYHLIDEEMIAEAYLKEQELKEVSNVSEYYITNVRKGKGEQSIYTYAELREVGTNELAISATLDYINKKILHGSYKLAKPKEEPVSVSVEEAANDYLTYWRGQDNKNLSNPIHAERCKNNFKAGVNWQKEQDKELIRELLEGLMLLGTDNKREDFIKISQSAITKSNQYLNQ
jgi:hypothetical protein